jgi:hypothetical protein
VLDIGEVIRRSSVFSFLSSLKDFIVSIGKKIIITNTISEKYPPVSEVALITVDIENTRPDIAREIARKI